MTARYELLTVAAEDVEPRDVLADGYPFDTPPSPPVVVVTVTTGSDLEGSALLNLRTAWGEDVQRLLPDWWPLRVYRPTPPLSWGPR